jgi:hypothetical protein
MTPEGQAEHAHVPDPVDPETRDRTVGLIRTIFRAVGKQPRRAQPDQLSGRRKQILECKNHKGRAARRELADFRARARAAEQAMKEQSRLAAKPLEVRERLAAERKNRRDKLRASPYPHKTKLIAADRQEFAFERVVTKRDPLTGGRVKVVDTMKAQGAIRVHRIDIIERVHPKVAARRAAMAVARALA